jgi:hypothetical protein
MSGRTLLLGYLAGAVVALVRTDGRALDRATLAVLWPLGPLAFVVTATILLLASPFAFVKR